MPGNIDAHKPRTPRAILQHYLRDVIYGANDGIITTFAVVAGVAGANLPTRTVLILGMANLLADGFSMGASNFLSIRSDEAVREAAGLSVQEPLAYRHGIATFAAFVVAGVVPLAAYVGPVGVELRFPIATVLTLATLFVVGALRVLVTTRHWLRSGAEMLVIGAGAAAVAYGVGALIAGLTRGTGAAT